MSAHPIATFVSDIHLGADVGPRHEAFVRYLEGLRGSTNGARRPPRVFVLGDLFEYWAGPSSERLPGHRLVLRALEETAASGVSITLLTGNRDFLVDGGVASRHGFELAPDLLEIELGSHRVIACHGDALLSDDLSHLRFRSVMRSFWIRALASALPARLVAGVAARLRRHTASRTRRKEKRSFRLPPADVARVLRGGHDVLICGHVHHESTRHITVDERECTVYSLGAWEDNASILEFDGESFRFVSTPIEELRRGR